MTLHEHAAALNAAAQAGVVEAAARLWSLLASLEPSNQLAIEMFPLVESATEAVVAAAKAMLRPEQKRSRTALRRIERELATGDGQRIPNGPAVSRLGQLPELPNLNPNTPRPRLDSLHRGRFSIGRCFMGHQILAVRSFPPTP